MISSRDIEANGFEWSYANTIPSLRIGKPIIVNTDLDGGPGIHWITLVKLANGVTYIYDPLGARNQRVSSDGTRTTDTITKGKRVAYYPYASQRASTTRCGWFALYVANLIRKLHRGNRTSTPSAIDITNMIKEHFGRSADKKDEEVLASGFI
jgi:hypothetical protein